MWINVTLKVEEFSPFFKRQTRQLNMSNLPYFPDVNEIRFDCDIKIDQSQKNEDQNRNEQLVPSSWRYSNASKFIKNGDSRLYSVYSGCMIWDASVVSQGTVN